MLWEDAMEGGEFEGDFNDDEEKEEEEGKELRIQCTEINMLLLCA